MSLHVVNLMRSTFRLMSIASILLAVLHAGMPLIGACVEEGHALVGNRVAEESCHCQHEEQGKSGPDFIMNRTDGCGQHCACMPVRPNWNVIQTNLTKQSQRSLAQLDNASTFDFRATSQPRIPERTTGNWPVNPQTPPDWAIGHLTIVLLN
jgi:hypothetical protein